MKKRILLFVFCLLFVMTSVVLAEDSPKFIGICTDASFPARTWEVQDLKSLGEEAGWKVEEQFADNNSSTQIQQIRSFVDQGVDAVVVNPVDMNTVGAAFEYAVQKGVKVLLYDRAVDDPNVAFVATYGSFNDGIVCAEELKKLDDGKENVVFELVGNRSDINAIERTEGFHSVADEMKNWKIVQIETDWNTEKALTGLQNALVANPDVWGIYCASSHMDGSIETALKEVNKWFKVGEEGHVNFVSLGGETPGPQICVDGYTDKLAVIHFDEMGAEVYNALVKIFNSEELENTRYEVSTVVYDKDSLIKDLDNLYFKEFVKLP